jgi:hypothetical protein
MTVLTYRSREEERADREQQELLLVALDAAPAQLRRDACGSWVITGRRGTVQTWGDGKTWLAYIIGRSPRHWTAIKQRLDFMTVTQDGDEEGCLRLFALPTPSEAVAIRDVMGLRKRVEYAPETLERKRASMARAVLARESPRTPLPGVAMPEEVDGDSSPQGGLTVEGATAPGVNGRFRAQGAMLAPGLVPDTTPTNPNPKSAAKASISAVAVTEPEEVS